MRFHVGVSFRLKSLKKLLIPILIGSLAYFGFGGLFGFLQVNAVVNTNTQNTLIIPEVSALATTYVDQTHTLLEFYQTLSTIPSSSNNDMIITQYTNNNGITYPVIYIYPKNSTDLYSFVSVSSDIRFRNSNNGTTYHKIEGLNFRNSADIYQSQFWTDIYSCYYNSNCSSSNFVSTVNLNYITIGFINSGSCSNNSNCNFSIPSNSFSNYETMFIYSTKQLELDQSYNTSSSSWYYKTNIINGNTYPIGSHFPMYFDLFSPTPPPEPEYFDGVVKYYDSFISNIPISNLSSLSLEYSFNYYTEDDYSPSQVFFYKRVNHGNYYSYEDISCTKTLSSAFTDWSITTTLTNISCSNISDSDEIFIRIRPNNGAYGQNITDFNYTLNYGYFSIIPIFNGDNKYRLMEHFIDFPADNNLVLTTLDETSYSYVDTTSNYLLSCRFDNSSGTPTGLCTNPYQFGSSFSSPANIIYNYLPENNNSTTFDLYFDENSILSSNSNNSNITYYDDTGSLTTEVINNQHLVNTSSYDMSSLFDRVDAFINSLQLDIYELHDLMQDCYDTIPVSLQMVIEILYIFVFTLLLFKVIRR